MNRLPESTDKAAPAGKIYRKDLLVRFSDCDPAGIVFYPKYFEMFNNLIEDWCRDGLDFSFVEIVARRGWGLPTVHLEVDFSAPSSFGETLHAQLRLRSVGNSSMTLEITLRGSDGVPRVQAKAVLVLIDRARVRAIAFPSEVRERLATWTALAANEAGTERP